MQASSSTPPSYTPPSKDVISVVPSLSALHPDPSHPAHSALLANLDLKKDSVRIFSFSSGGIVVCPEDADRSRTEIEEEETWAKVGGYLQVVSTSKKTVPQISVKIVGLQSLAFPQDRGAREEVDQVFCKEVVLKDVQLQKGLNHFEFLLAIPHDAPTHEDSSFASLKHRAVGTVVGGAKRVFGLRDLVVEETVWLAAAPSTSSDPESLSLNVHVEGLTEALGPCSLDVSSSLFIVAGPLSISLTLHSPPPTLKVYALKCFIDQTINLTSFQFPTKKATVLRTGMVLEEGWNGPYGSKSFARLVKDGTADEATLFNASVGVDDGGSTSWTFDKVARIPSDRVVRPSTHPNTKTCIRVTSELVVDLYFTSSEPSSSPDKVLIATVLRRPVSLASCGCLSSRISLPDYTQTSNKFVPITVSVPCKCDEPSDKLLADETEYVRSSRAAHASSSSGGERLDPEASVLLGRKIGEAY